jgi:putative acetyltransferase
VVRICYDEGMSGTEKTIIDVQIESVQAQELPELAELATRAFSDAFGSKMEPERLAQTLAETRSVAYFEKTLPTSKVVVAKLDGKIVGYAQYGSVKIPEVAAGKDDREFGRLYVDTSLHGLGIGRQLMATVLNDPEMARAPNIYLQVWEKSHVAMALYRSFGFKECGVTHFMLAGKPAQDLIMVRKQKNKSRQLLFR